MPNAHLTDITLLIDRSGSMSSIKAEANGAVNHFIESQKDGDGQVNISIYQFDNLLEKVCVGKPISEAPQFEIFPRGMTALYDAMGKVMIKTGQRLADMAESDRPGLVIVVIMTDGLENNSVEFTQAQIAEMVKHQEEKYSWKFTYLGANQDAILEAGKVGLSPLAAATYAPSKIKVAMQNTGHKVLRMRKQSVSGQTVQNTYSTQELNDMQ